MVNAMANTLVKNGTRLTVLTLLSRILGLLREMTKAAFLGTSALSDAFTVAFMVPNLLRRLFAENSISVAFIPTFRQYVERGNKTEIREFLSAIFTLFSFVTSITVVIGIAITPLIIPFFGTGTPETVLLTRIMFPYLAIISIAALFQGMLNSVKSFSPSGFTPILFNGIIILCTYLLSPIMANPARAMAVGVLLGGIVQALFQLPFVLHHGFHFSLLPVRRAFRDPGTRKVLRLIGPTIIGMAAYQLNDLVSTILAGNAGHGVVSSLQYSLRMQELILGIFAVSIGTVILPDLSGLAARKDWLSFNKLLTLAINSIALITIPVTFYSLVSGKGLITLLFKSHSFSDDSVQLTLNAFTWHISGLFFIAVNRIIAPAFYAQSDTRSPTISGILSFGVNIALALLLVTPMKGGGIALALSLASAANTIFLVFFLHRNASIDIGMVLHSTILYALKIVVFSLVAIFPVWYLRTQLYAPFAHFNRFVAQGIPLTASFAISGIIFAVLLAVTRDKLALQLVSGIRRKLKNRM
jgi:putative peptidoglycan lipid II flippase